MGHRRRRRNRWYWFVALSALGRFAFADTPETPGLDLIVMIDRSGSMASIPVQALPIHGGDLVAYSAEANRVSHRIAIITFGPDARIDVPLGRPNRPDVMAALRGTRQKARGHTDVLAAFQAAASHFDATAGDPSRKRAVVVVTDGIPNVPGIAERDYADALKQFAATHLSGVGITVLLVRRRRPQDDALWREIASDRVYEVVPRRDDIVSELHRVVTSLLGTAASESRAASGFEVIELPPYLDFVVFDVVGERSNEVVVLPAGSDGPLDRSARGVEFLQLGNALSTIIVQRPHFGRWMFRIDGEATSVRVFSQNFFPRGVLLNPAAGDPVRTHDRVPLTYRVLDGEGRPLAETAGQPLALDLQLITPDGVRTAFPMRRRTDLGTSTFAANPVACSLPGRYWTEVRITTMDRQGQPVEVFRDRWSGFSVEDARLIDCQASPPQPRALLSVRPLGIRINCPDPSGRTHLESDVAGLFHTVVLRNGRPVESTVAFHHIGGNTFNGIARGVSLPGSYVFRLSIDRTRMRKTPYNIRIHPRELFFRRAIDTSDWIAGFALFGAVIAGLLFARNRRIIAAKRRTPN